MLGSLRDLGYHVEWRVVNAADYGFPQKRRRVYIVAHRADTSPASLVENPVKWFVEDGPIARALPADAQMELDRAADFSIEGSTADITDGFGVGHKTSRFQNAGIMVGSKVWTFRVTPDYQGPRETLGNILDNPEDVPPEFWVEDPESITRWKQLKGAKSITRISKQTGASYTYDEGKIPFPDRTDGPARTIVTGEGGKAASRFKHLIEQNGRFRRLTPRELEQLNGFEPGWTAIDGVPDGRKAFLMGNALVVGVVQRIGQELARL